MPHKLTEEELRELARWLEREVVSHPFYARFLGLVDSRIADKQDAAMSAKDDNAWDRGYVEGMKAVRNKPDQLIRNHASSRDTETPAGGDGRKDA
jgi:hypothetical protein